MNIVAPREIKNLSRTTSFRTLNSLAWPDSWMHGLQDYITNAKLESPDP